MRTLNLTLSKGLLAALIAVGSTAPCLAEERHAALTLQNDFFLGDDGGGYTSGIFGSSLRVASTGEDGVAPVWALAPLSRWLALPKPTLASAMVGQVIVTPADITRAVPDPADAPYLGALMFRATHVYVAGDVADMVSFELGVIGPASGAAQTQRAVHRLTGSKRPQGWDTQLPNRLLAGIEAYRAQRFSIGRSAGENAQADVVVSGGGRLDSLQSSVGGTALARYGTGLERSLPTTLRLNGGTTASPFVVGRGWFVFAGISADHLFHAAGVGSAATGNTAQLRRLQIAAQAGASYGTPNGSITFAVVSASPLVESGGARQSYGSITYTHALR